MLAEHNFNKVRAFVMILYVLREYVMKYMCGEVTNVYDTACLCT